MPSINLFKPKYKDSAAALHASTEAQQPTPLSVDPFIEKHTAKIIFQNPVEPKPTLSASGSKLSRRAKIAIAVGVSASIAALLLLAAIVSLAVGLGVGLSQNAGGNGGSGPVDGPSCRGYSTDQLDLNFEVPSASFSFADQVKVIRIATHGRMSIALEPTDANTPVRAKIYRQFYEQSEQEHISGSFKFDDASGMLLISGFNDNAYTAPSTSGPYYGMPAGSGPGVGHPDMPIWHCPEPLPTLLVYIPANNSLFSQIQLEISTEIGSINAYLASGGNANGIGAVAAAADSLPLPLQQFASLKAHANTGQVILSGIELLNGSSIDVSMGSALLENLSLSSSGNLSLSVASGSVRAQNLRVLSPAGWLLATATNLDMNLMTCPRILVTATEGSVSLHDLQALNTLSVDANRGDINVQLQEQSFNGTYITQTVSGQIRVSGKGVTSSSNISGTIGTPSAADDSNMITLRSLMGDITLAVVPENTGDVSIQPVPEPMPM